MATQARAARERSSSWARALLAAFLLACLTSDALTQDHPLVRLRVRIVPADKTMTLPASLSITATPVGSAYDQPRRFILDAALKGIDLPAGRWLLSASVPGAWIEDRVTNVQPDRLDEVVLRAWPSGVVSAPLRFPSEMTGSPQVRIGVRRPDEQAYGKNRILPASVECPIRSGRIVCELPEGVFDLRFAVPGFAPVYRWSTRIARERTTELPTLEFRAGASIMGFVVDKDRQRRPGVRIAVLTADGELIEQRSISSPGYIRRRPLEAQTNARGFFQIAELAPGQYKLLAKATVDGTTATAVAGVNAGSETRLDHAMVLTEPVAVDVFIEPPHHPTGARWTAVFQNIDTSPSDTPLRRPVPSTGALHVARLAEGPYFLVVEMNGQRWFGEEVEVTAPMTRLDVRLPLIPVRGQLHFGGSPLAAALVFGGRHAMKSIELRSDSDGVFEGYLPADGYVHAGDWPVDIEAHQPPVRRMLKHVRFTEGIGGIYTTTIELPNTNVLGQVIDESSRRVEGAIVNIRPMGDEDTSFQITVDSDGRFEAWGLPDTSVLISAVAPGNLAADPQIAIPSQGNAPGDRVQIVVRPSQILRGRVILEDGSPVPGALVKTTPIGPNPSMGSPLRSTDGEGRFEVHLPPGVEAADVTFGTPSQSFQIMRISRLTGEEISLPLEAIGGRLSVEFSNARDRRLEGLAIFHRGAAEFVSFLKGLDRRQDSRDEEASSNQPGQVRKVELNSLASGDYVACFVAGDQAPIAQPPMGEECASGTLGPGGVLYLRLP